MNVHVACFISENLNRPDHMVIAQRPEREREHLSVCLSKC